MIHRAGFVNIIGRPNAGKSTLMNLLVGEKISIISPKAQTTRHRILGIVNTEDCQVVFSDTPGILDVSYGLHKTMMSAVMTALTDADIILYLADLTSEKSKAEDPVIEKINKSDIPVLVALNKSDLVSKEIIEKKITEWKNSIPRSEIFVISALKAIDTSKLMHRILELLPENPPYYEKDALTDRDLRFISSEIIREKIFTHFHQEIPYSVHVEILSFKEEPSIIRISAVIHVARESQKGILIGANGRAIKKIGTESRIELERFLEKQVFLDLNVKVSKDWRNDEARLRSFGYNT